jgi:hypothetical protein
MDWQVNNEMNIPIAAPKGAVETEQFAAPLKRCPDTKRKFFRSVLAAFSVSEIRIRACLQACRKRISMSAPSGAGF